MNTNLVHQNEKNPLKGKKTLHIVDIDERNFMTGYPFNISLFGEKFTSWISMSPEYPKSNVVQILEETQGKEVLVSGGFLFVSSAPIRLQCYVELNGHLSDVL